MNMIEELMEQFEASKKELTALSDELSAAVKDMESAKVVLDDRMSAVRRLQEKLADANAKYIELEKHVEALRVMDE
jgi:predicted  nucleic acid-binding Zn-ribbon protein